MAAVVAAPDPASWMAEKKTWLNANHWPALLGTLRPSVEPDNVEDAAASVRVSAIFPTGPAGNIRGRWPRSCPSDRGRSRAHRYIMQSRLKRVGTRWTADNLENMLALRALRANHEWDAYRSRVNQQAA